MTVLLDTHALLWWLNGRDRLGANAKTTIENATNTVLVSPVSAWEITTKYRIGKLPEVAPIIENLAEVIAAEGFGTLSISLLHAHRAGLLPGEHRDPFDRMLIAQALTENIPIATNEVMFEQFGVRRVW